MLGDSLLTLDQQRVARLIANGSTDEEIAESMEIKLRSAKDRIAEIYQTLGLGAKTKSANRVLLTLWVQEKLSEGLTAEQAFGVQAQLRNRV